MNKRGEGFQTTHSILTLSFIIIVLMAISFVFLSFLKAPTNLTGYTILGTNCSGNCKTMNASILGVLILSFILISITHTFVKRKKIN